MAAASEDLGVVTNGMSEYRRDGFNANAALLVGVTPLILQVSIPGGYRISTPVEGLAYQLGVEIIGTGPVNRRFPGRPVEHQVGKCQTNLPGVVLAQLRIVYLFTSLRQ